NGIVEQVGAPLDLFNRPANTFVAGFIGSPHMNLLVGHLTAPDRLVLPGGGAITLPQPLAGATVGQPVSVGIRPQHLALADYGIAAEVILVEALGTETILH
ncbi:sugar ABC transporter ATP-binding protein, partial [Mycobacterium tuberculosis]|nr:sugar ABC transporter ATP-binding protein [Mycobacterium tuberculosis]